jgi:hypothetical protein
MEDVAKTADELVGVASDLIDEIKADANDTFQSKAKVSNILMFIYRNVSKLVEFSEEATGRISGLGSEKKQFVCETIRSIYKSVDPNIPWLIDPFESLLENFILDNVVPPFVDYIVSKVYNEHGIFDKLFGEAPQG